MNFKSFDSDSIHVKTLNKLIQLTQPSKVMPKFEKPAGELVRLEQLPKGSRYREHCPPLTVGSSQQPPPKEVAGGKINDNHPPAIHPSQPSTSKENVDKRGTEKCGDGSNGGAGDQREAEPIINLPPPSGTPAVQPALPKPFLCQLGVEYFIDNT